MKKFTLFCCLIALCVFVGRGQLDHYRVVSNDLYAQVCHADGSCEPPVRVKNLRTNAGNDAVSAALFSGTQPAQFTYVAISTDTTTPAATDTTCASELTTNGLGRATGTWTHTAGTSSSNWTHTWTYTGSTSVTIAKACMFNASSSGTLGWETLLLTPQTVQNNGDTFAISGWMQNY